MSAASPSSLPPQPQMREERGPAPAHSSSSRHLHTKIADKKSKEDLRSKSKAMEVITILILCRATNLDSCSLGLIQVQCSHQIFHHRPVPLPSPSRLFL